VDAGGVALRLLEWGEPGRPPVCLLHGGAAHVHWFDAVVPALAGDLHVVAFDQRGHGESGWAHPPAYATQDFAADVGRVLDALGWPAAAIVGHSMGGHNAMAFAAWHPERVRALAIVDARPALPPERLAQMRERGRRPPRRFPSREAATASFRLLPPDTVADPGLLAHLAGESVTGEDSAWRYRFDPACFASRHPVDAWPLLARITAPTLVVRGEWSPVLPREVAERLRQGIAGARLAEIAGAYHHLVLDRPAAAARVLGGFLREPRGP
jgi:pimeloyl-ACP methyl ester carboxylesterase